MNLAKPGKLWAIDGHQLLWTNAYVQEFSEPYSTDKYIIEMDIDFVLYEGVWHKADVRKTFLQPYDSCNFAQCLDFREIDECLDCCVNCQQPKPSTCNKCRCECDFLTAEWSLCELKKEIAADFYGKCNNSYRIIYNCEAGKKIWGEEKMLGEKICKPDTCKDIIAGQFYSETVLDSENVMITLIGGMKNPIITVNGNTMQIMGEYYGKLTLTSSGDIYYLEDECCNELMIDINRLVIPEGSTFGFLIHQGMNSVIVETNNCCDMTCIYLKIDNITV